MKKTLFFLIFTASITFGQNQFNWYRQTTYTASGTDTYTATIASLPIVTDQVISVNFTNANTSTTPTININATGAKTIQAGGVALSAGQLRGQRTLKCDGINWQLQGDGGSSSGGIADLSTYGTARNFGTQDNFNLNLRTNNINRLTIDPSKGFNFIDNSSVIKFILGVSGNAEFRGITDGVGDFGPDFQMGSGTRSAPSSNVRFFFQSRTTTNYTPTNTYTIDPNFRITAGNVQFASTPSGVYTNLYITGGVLSHVTASQTLAQSASVYIEPPTAGTNLELTNPYTLYSNGKIFTNSLRVGNSATAGHVLTADASGNGTWQAPKGSFGANFSKYVATTVSNTTTETSILGTGSGTATIAANELVLGKRYRVFFITSTSTPNATSRTVTIRLKIGGTTVNTITVTFAAITTNQFNNYSGEFVCTATGVSGSVYSELINIVLPTGGTVTVNTTTSAAVDVTAQWSDAVAGNTVVCNSLSITPLN